MNDKVFLDEEKMAISLDKISLYKREEELSFDNINNLIIGINSTYNTDNKRYLNSKVDSIRKKINLINRIHDNNINVLEKKIEIHLDLKRRNSSIMGSSNVGDIEVIK